LSAEIPQLGQMRRHGSAFQSGKRALSQVNVDPHWAQNPRRVPGDELNFVISPFVTV